MPEYVYQSRYIAPTSKWAETSKTEHDNIAAGRGPWNYEARKLQVMHVVSPMLKLTEPEKFR